jgi:hypothetical protein
MKNETHICDAVNDDCGDVRTASVFFWREVENEGKIQRQKVPNGDSNREPVEYVLPS